MKYKKQILVLSYILIVFIYILNPYIESEAQSIDGFKKDIIRFHIRANSDLEEDQELKLKIRDEILKVMGKKFQSIETIEESREIIMDNLSKMKSIAEGVIHREGKAYEVEVSLGQDNFPIRKYGSMILPQGEYETLLIEIGEAKGQNWWCVMFPPLCFVDITHSTALVTDEIDTGELGEFVIDESQPLKFKSLIAEKIGKLFD